MIQDRKIEARIRSCNRCSGGIIWLRTNGGKRIPIDADTVEEFDHIYDPQKHRCHFQGCRKKVLR